MKIFSKQKMMDRLQREGRLDEIDEQSKEIMNALDGKEAVRNDFRYFAYDELEYVVRHEDKWYPVNPDDCIQR